MNYQASRLATEEADFRPALTPRFIDGAFAEKRMKPDKCNWCEGAQSELRRRVLGNGSMQIVYQCLTCGRSASNPLPKTSVPNFMNLPAWDDDAAETYDKLKALARLEKRSEWFAEHNEYLKTEEWRAKRAAVMERSKGLCEGCRCAYATQVHHLTYIHWKNELLWELVAVCDDCHDRAHGERQPYVVGMPILSSQVKIDGTKG